MEGNLQEDKLPDGTIQFTSRYVFAKEPEEAFPVSKSNYETALRQSRTNYKKMLDSQGGREAVKTMVDRGREDNHFKILTKDEADFIMSLPHNFCRQTTAWKDSLTTKV